MKTNEFITVLGLVACITGIMIICQIRYGAGVNQVRSEAVKAGAAQWGTSEDGSAVFLWKGGQH